MSVVVITPPKPLLDLPTVKQHLRLDDDDTDNDLILAVYMAAAQASIDGPGGWLGRCIGQQTLELRLDGFTGSPIWSWATGGSELFWSANPGSGLIAGPAARVTLPYPPLVSVVSVTYQDTTGADVELPSAAYLASDDGVDAAYGTYFPDGRWAPDALRIRYTAGYETVPPTIIAALLLMVGDLFANRGTTIDGRAAGAAVVPMSLTVETLLGPYRVFA